MTISMDGKYYRRGDDKKLVPLDWADIKVGVTMVRDKRWLDGLECSVQWRAFNSIGITVVTKPLQIRFTELQKDYDYSNDHGSTWHPCSKAAP